MDMVAAMRDKIPIVKNNPLKPYCVAITTQINDNGDYYKSRGFDDILVKPIDSDGIGRIIDSFIKKKSIKNHSC